MEDQYVHTLNGQSALQDDFNTLGKSSGLADDRVFAELFRMPPYDGSNVRKGVLPAGYAGSGISPLVAPNGATGQIVVHPHRTFVGSRTAVGANVAKENWRDIRSAIGVGASALAETVSFSANASGNPRWDLVYEAIVPDANTASVNRKRKDPATKVITTASVVTRKNTARTLGVTAGTAAASPVFPAVPADSGGVYYVPIAYVRIPNGFTASSTVLPSDIALRAPIIAISRTTGGLALSVATSMYDVSTAQQQSWGATGTRKRIWVPPDLSGGETLIGFLDLQNASSANWSHQHNGIVDSRDWRGRFCRWAVTIADGGAGLGDGYPWNKNFGSDSIDEGSGDVLLSGISQTVTADNVSFTESQVVNIDGDAVVPMADGTDLRLYVDHNDGGKLKVAINGVPATCFNFWIDWSAPYTNK